MNGMVFWITGLPGTGKTTLGNALYYHLRQVHDNVVILDGNIVKDIVSNDAVSYTREGRKARAYQYARLCQLLAGQGMLVICCTVSLYHDIQQWNRAHIPGYIEVFMDADHETLQQMNHRGVYADGMAAFGHVDLPASPDLVIHNAMDAPVEDCVERILRLKPQEQHQTKKYKTYWDAYYKAATLTQRSSDFARFALPYMQKGGLLIDLGCGNGRDSLFFAENGLKVTSVDLSSAAIDLVCSLRGELPVFAVCDDFVISKALFSIEYNYCYSRWTLHSLDEQQEKEIIRNVYNALKPGGLFFIEARTVRDDIYGVGEQVGQHAFIHNQHYRRFLDPDVLADQLRTQGFAILCREEGRGFSKTAESDPVLLRIVAEKQGA